MALHSPNRDRKVKSHEVQPVSTLPLSLKATKRQDNNTFHIPTFQRCCRDVPSFLYLNPNGCPRSLVLVPPQRFAHLPKRCSYLLLVGCIDLLLVSKVQSLRFFSYQINNNKKKPKPAKRNETPEKRTSISRKQPLVCHAILPLVDFFFGELLCATLHM